jgi:hypothetical protein
VLRVPHLGWRVLFIEKGILYLFNRFSNAIRLDVLADEASEHPQSFVIATNVCSEKVENPCLSPACILTPQRQIDFTQ